MKKLSIVVAAVVGLVIVAGILLPRIPRLNVNVPDFQEPGELIQVSQGWTDAERLRFHHTAQGTRLLPYAWFMALEQPCFSLFGCGRFADRKYLGRFGFLESKQDRELNPGNLPVGFALKRDFHDTLTRKTYPAVGLTCAACHTGQLRYGKYAVQIDGAPAMIEVTQLQKAIGLAFVFTKLIPFRYGRFESNVLGANATAEQKKELKADFEAFLAMAKEEKDAVDAGKIYDNQAGFIRTDALTRIGNQVFGVDMKNPKNFAQANAPVRFPQIWDASWFTWVQYNSSISDPLVRNIGESLGVRAMARLSGPDAGQYDNSVSVDGLWFMEELLSGKEPFQGLHSPKWPSVFPALDQAKAAKGAALYKQHCQGCHLPPVDELIADLHSARPAHWWKNKLGRQLLKVTDVQQTYVGTDGHEALDFISRTADTGDLGKGRVSAAAGLDLVTKNIALLFFNKMNFAPEKRLEWSGNHDPNDPAVRAEPVYKARPLNGIWAVGPYLHNGSVPNLYLLLSPVSERPKTFWLGNKQFDPVKVGYDVSELQGGYRFDITQPGNSNTGHEFKAGPRGNGVVGPALSVDDRWALIEYLKSI